MIISALQIVPEAVRRFVYVCHTPTPSKAPISGMINQASRQMITSRMYPRILTNFTFKIFYPVVSDPDFFFLYFRPLLQLVGAFDELIVLIDFFF